MRGHGDKGASVTGFVDPFFPATYIYMLMRSSQAGLVFLLLSMLSLVVALGGGASLAETVDSIGFDNNYRPELLDARCT